MRLKVNLRTIFFNSLVQLSCAHSLHLSHAQVIPFTVDNLHKTETNRKEEKEEEEEVREKKYTHIFYVCIYIYIYVNNRTNLEGIVQYSAEKRPNS